MILSTQSDGVTPDTCIAVSGQIRGDVESLSEYASLARKYNCAVVVSTWARSGFKESGPFRFPQRERLVGKALTEALPISWQFPDFWKYFPELNNKKDLLRRDVDGGTIAEIMGGLSYVADVQEQSVSETQCFTVPVWDSNSKRMLYKIHRANEFKKMLELELGGHFSRVIRCRPDYQLREECVANRFDLPSKIYVSWAEKSGLSDEAAISNSAVADLYASLYLLCQDEPARPWGGIHRELANLFARANIEPVARTLGGFRTYGELETQFAAAVALRNDDVSRLCHASSMLARAQTSTKLQDAASVEFADVGVILASLQQSDRLIQSSLLRVYARYYAATNASDAASACALLSLYDIAESEATGADSDYIRWARDIIAGQPNIESVPKWAASLLSYWDKCMNYVTARR